MRKVSLPPSARWAILLGLAGLTAALIIVPTLARAQTGGTGTILREYWNNISGTAVSNLTSNASYPNNPTGSQQLTALEGPTNAADNYGSRIRGYVHPPATGAYTFWLASDDSGELWLSTSDNPANAARIAYVNGWTNSREWTKFASQQSAAITLTAGQRYYIEVLQKEGNGGDNVAVAWQGPGISQAVIAGSYLSPFGSQPSETVSINAGGSATGSFTADQYFSGGSTYTNTRTIDMSQLTTNLPPAEIFNTERYGAMTYTIPNRSGAQTVTLYFAENYVTAAGQRVFNVSINGTAALSNFDIFAAAGGADRAIARTFNTTANSSGQVAIQFTAVTENPKLSGITVAGGSPTPTTPPPTTPPVTTPPPTTPPPGGVSINAGGSATGSFTADQYFSGGTTYTNTATIDMSLIPTSPPPAAIFNTERYGVMTYTIPNRSGAQTVTLYFAETYLTAAGQRLFNVSINGTAALSNFDIYASAGGQNRAIARTFNTTANSSGQVVIQFTAVTENPKINGITVTPGSVPIYELTITNSTNGSTTPPAGTYNYAAGTAVIVTATPASGYRFTGWSYSAAGTTNPLVVIMDASKGLAANFAPIQTDTYTLAISTTGNGTTNPAPGTYTYNSGASVTVSAVPSSGATFTGWSGAATGTSNPVTVTMNGNKTLTAAFSGGSQVQACPALPGAPTGTAPLPSPAQAAYQRTEMTAFIHYSLATYDGSEQGNPSDPPSLFNPSNLNAATVDQWVSSLKAAGFRQVMLVAKHSVGFTLWPSNYTTYSVKSSPWMNGQGDVVRLFTDSMRAAGMRVALYLGPWDQKYPSSSSSYETYYKNQVNELLSYGPAYEFEFDGFNAPTSNVNWRSVFQMIKQSQPNILLWAGPEIVNTGAIPDLQWIGNENGQASRSTSSLDTRNCGGGSTWCPFECNVSSRRPHWFWHPADNPMSLSDMQKVYFATVGMNCTLNFNVPPSQTGAFDQKDLSLLQQFGAWYSALYNTNLAKGRQATADSTWANTGFEAAKAVDDEVCTYWAAASGRTTARFEVPLASPTSLKLISIREAIELGERVKTYHIEIKQNGTWNRTPTDASGVRLQGTVIGQRQLWQLNLANVEAVALVIDSAKDAPAIAEFSVY